MANKSHILMMVLLVCGSINVPEVEGGPAAYGICQTGCNTVWVACVAGAGGTAGVSTGGVGVPAAIAACNTAQGVCMAACIAAGLAPTPWNWEYIEYLFWWSFKIPNYP